MRLSLFATDLDGTVLIDRGEAGCHATPRLKAALKALQDSGTVVCLASGRMHGSITRIGAEMGLKGPVISYNGGMVSEASGAVLWHKTLDAALAQEIAALAEARGLPLNFYLDEVLYARKIQPWWDLYHGRTTSPMREVDSYKGLAGRRPTKLLIHAPPAVVAALKAELVPVFGERCDLLVTSDEYLEFMPLGVDKSHALAYLAGRLGLEAEQVGAAGDGWNDLKMLQWAGLSVAVETGRKDLHPHADFVVPGPEEDGLAVWIEENLL